MNKEKLLEELVIEHSGVWPKRQNVPLVYKGSHIYIPEFEQKAKEMGYINGYRYGVEYPTNGEKPDLPDGVRVAFKGDEEFWQEYGGDCDEVQNWYWKNSLAFRIIDLRYKPSDTSYLVERGMELVNQIQEKLESVTEKLEANSWWDYENDKPLSFPPAGTRCLVSYKTLALKHEWIETFIVGIGVDGSCVFDLMERPDTDNPYDGWLSPERFRPLDYFTRKEADEAKDALINAATDILYKHACATKGELIDGAKALYDAGYLVLPKKE
jgi:hypothetical protein